MVQPQGKATGPWFAGRRPVVRFVLLFGFFLAAFNLFFYLYLLKTDFFESYLGLNARAGAGFLRMMGEEITVNGDSIDSPRFHLSIKRGCDALQASAFFAIGVLASPLRVPFRRRILSVLVGMAGLLLLNLVRIISLYYAGVYSRPLFDVLHIEVWQALFIFAPLFLWVLWVRRVARASRTVTDVPA